METFIAFAANYIESTFGAIVTFAATPFAEQPFAWMGVWGGCVAVGLLIGWGIVADARK